MLGLPPFCRDERHLAEQVLVAQLLRLLPGPVRVCEIDPITQGRMAPAPELMEWSRPGHSEVLLLQPYKRSGRRVVLPGDFEGEPIRFPFLITVKRKHDRR